ncbi:MAG: MFS transporter [Novosphingobium sp.]
MRIKVFRRFWLATMASNFGGLIQTVAAAWMMTSLTGNAQMVALVQTFSTLPMMLISLPAGALADLYERRNIMLVAQSGMLAVATGLAILAALSLATPAVLLIATFLIGAGTALNAPSWQASLRDQVPREHIEAAANLNSVGFNVARSLGPAIGGMIVALAGVAAAFAANAFSYVGLILTLLSWKRPRHDRTLPPEGVPQAIRAGVRYVAFSPSLVAVLVRTSTFGLCGSSVWALSAILARDALDGGAATYGLLLGGFGVGAVIGALLRATLPIGRDLLVKSCSLAFGLAAILLGLSHNLYLSIALTGVTGGAWMVALTGLGVSVQLIAPRWVVGRAMSLNQMSIFAGMALGSWFWGFIAQSFDVRTAFVASGCAMLATLLLTFFFPLTSEESLDLTPMRSRPIDDLDGPVGPNDGPIVVTIEYRVLPENFRAFVTAMDDLGRIRRRNGAHRWTLHQDVDTPTRWVERFHSLTWLDHLRRQTRHTQADQSVSNRVAELHEGPIIVNRMLERRIWTVPIAPIRRLDDGSDI